MCNFCECQSLRMNMTLPQYRRYFRMLSIRMRMRNIFEGTNHWIAWIRFRAITYTDYCSFLVFFSLLFSSRLSVYCYYYSKCVYISRLFTACLFIYLFCCNFLCVLCLVGWLVVCLLFHHDMLCALEEKRQPEKKETVKLFTVNKNDVKLHFIDYQQFFVHLSEKEKNCICFFFGCIFRKNWNHKFLVHLAWMQFGCVRCGFFARPLRFGICLLHTQYNNNCHTYQNEPKFQIKLHRNWFECLCAARRSEWKFKSQNSNREKNEIFGRSYKVHAKRIRFAFGNDKKWEDECHVNCQPGNEDDDERNNSLVVFTFYSMRP